MAVAGIFDTGRIEAIAANLDLRQPNREALESIAFETIQHFEIDVRPAPFEAVVDSATGVGKTYILAAAIDYFAAEGVRNFAVIAPGRTILEKTVANFTPGHPRSLLHGMEVQPIVITSDNFATAAMRAAMDDPSQVKLFIFTVQALLKPTTRVGRKTHSFQEGLGEAFYGHLQGLPDLVVFADEHHTYYGKAFSEAIRDLQPQVLIGLTATPHPKTPPDQIIYRYPLAAAIADHLVKTPVLVGRKDDRSDATTKLHDGVRLLELKEAMVERWCTEQGAEPVQPVMLVIAQTIEDADEVSRIVRDDSFAAGRYRDAVLTVHSNAPDEALEALERLEEPGNPYRIVVSVGMLKEGWDVKNVYVIASLRASVSDILTEQTLGRGLRLPFGHYTGIELLDTLEVLGHERYEDLLKKAGVINQQFIDRRTRAVLRENAQGQLVSVVETVDTRTPLVTAEDGAQPGTATIQPLERRTELEQTELRLQVELPPRPDAPPLMIPRLRMTPVESDFSLADITDLDPFRRLGSQLATDPVDELRRVKLSAQVVQGEDGLRRTELVTARAVDHVDSPLVLYPLDQLRQFLIDGVLAAPVVPARPKERVAVQPLVDAFLEGLGSHATPILSGYLDRAVAGLIQLVTQEQRRYAAKPRYDEVVELSPFRPNRIGRLKVSQDRYSAFEKGVGYCYEKSLYRQDWFDSSTERTVANLLDDSDAITLWVRLQIGDLPILWTGAGRQYNPDFLATDEAGMHWIVEVKMNREMGSADVQGKREAAQRWANHVSADPQVQDRWRYLLVSEDDVATARGSWEALRKAGE